MVVHVPLGGGALDAVDDQIDILQASAPISIPESLDVRSSAGRIWRS